MTSSRRVFIDAFYREAREEAELAKHRAERPKLQQQFVDLKRGLAAVTDEEWTNIPEVGNLTRKKRKRDFERSWAVPDSVIVGNRASTEYESSLDAKQQVGRVNLLSPHPYTLTVHLRLRGDSRLLQILEL